MPERGRRAPMPQRADHRGGAHDARGFEDDQEQAHRFSPCSRTRFSMLGQPPVFVVGERLGRHVEERRHRRAGRIVEERPHQLLQRRPARLFRLRRRKVRIARAVVLAAEEAALDHDVQQLAHAGRAGRVRQLRPDVLDGRALPPVHDRHDLAFAPGEIDGFQSGHGRSRRYGEFFRPWRIYSRAPAGVKRSPVTGLRRVRR